MEVSGWFIFAVCCLFEVLVLLKQECTKSDVSKPTCPFPYCLPLAFLRLESDTSSLTRLLVYFWARPPVWFPTKQCSAMCMCVQTCGRIDVFSTQWVCLSIFAWQPDCMCLFFSRNILDLICQDKKDAHMEQPPTAAVSPSFVISPSISSSVYTFLASLIVSGLC